MEPYSEIARTEDTVTMRIQAPTLFELVDHASVAMFSIGFDLAAIPPTYSRPLVAPGDTFRDLLTNWLHELVLLREEEGIVWSQVAVDRLEVGGVQGSASGQYRKDVIPAGRFAARVVDVSDVVEVPDGYWIDVVFGVEGDLRLV